MGSLITLLTVADILGNNTAAMATYSKRLVLTALMGEPWGYMGSKRLLWEMYTRADTTTGLDVDNIQQASSLTTLCAETHLSDGAFGCLQSSDTTYLMKQKMAQAVGFCCRLCCRLVQHMPYRQRNTACKTCRRGCYSFTAPGYICQAGLIFLLS